VLLFVNLTGRKSLESEKHKEDQALLLFVSRQERTAPVQAISSFPLTRIIAPTEELLPGIRGKAALA
jgi:hypothetical protein